jgi:hypothetical protein
VHVGLTLANLVLRDRAELNGQSSSRRDKRNVLVPMFNPHG